MRDGHPALYYYLRDLETDGENRPKIHIFADELRIFGFHLDKPKSNTTAEGLFHEEN